MNPICFIAASALVGLGACNRWLTRGEATLSVALLAIPYITKGFGNTMLSQARFSAVVFPAYIVAGHLLAKLPPWLAWMILGLSAALMGIYAGEYAAGKMFF